MKKLILLLMMSVATFWTHAQFADRDKADFSGLAPESGSSQKVFHKENDIDVMLQEPEPDRILRTPVHTLEAEEDVAKYLGNTISDKLKYAVFQFGSSDNNMVATLVGWNDSYDYYPHIVVPDNISYNGKTVPVTSINNSAFWGGWGITGLTLGKNLISIGSQAFSGCNITDVTIPVSVRYIMASAFESCSLNSVIFENADSTGEMLIIGQNAFAYTNIKTFEIPARLKIFDDYSFRETFNNPLHGSLYLESITINPKFFSSNINRNYTLEIIDDALCLRKRLSDDDGDYLYVIAYPPARANNEVSFEAEVIDVFDYACENSKINKFTLTSNYESREGSVNIILGRYSLAGSDVSSVNLNANGHVKLLATFSRYCRNLAGYNLSETITNFRVIDGIMYAKKDGERYLVNYPAGLRDESFAVPSDVLHLAEGSFNANSYIKEVTLPSDLKTIGKEAFFACQNLERFIYSGSSLSSIEENAFTYTKFLTSGPDGEVTLGNWLVGYIGEVPSSLIISENIKNSVAGIFQYKFGINSVVFPKDFENIPKDMFYGCSALTNIQLPQNLKTIGDYAFTSAGSSVVNAPSLSRSEKSLVIPEGVTKIGMYAFAYSNVADKLVLPSTLESLENQAFNTNSNLQEVEMHRLTPPGAEIQDVEGIFNSWTLQNGTLIIPKNAEVTDFTDNEFWNFINIKKGDFTSVDDIEIENDVISISSGTIYSTDGSSMMLYGIDGRLVGCSDSFSGLTPGLYILRHGSGVRKVIIP